MQTWLAFKHVAFAIRIDVAEELTRLDSHLEEIERLLKAGGELGKRLDEIPKSAPVVVCCASGTRSGMARMMLKKNGYPQVFNAGKWSNLLG